MKKLLILVGLGLMTGSLWAACNGPFCWDDTGASIGGVAQNGNGTGMPLLTKAQVAAAVPVSKGMALFCTDCILSGGLKGTVCVSTAATVGAYMAVSSNTVVTACQ